jgi:MFS family permease
MSLSPRHSVIIALIVASAYFMENLDATVIATALPHMAVTFGITAVSLSIGMTAYLLALAVFIPISGWIADRFGQRSVFGSAVIVFTGASILCGLSHNLPEFTAARLLQGIGGAMMVPVGRLAVLRSTEKRHLMRSIAYITWPGLAAPVLGPALGGFLSTYFSWRWIFLLNVPIGLLGLTLTAIFIPNFRDPFWPPIRRTRLRADRHRAKLPDVRYGTRQAIAQRLAHHDLHARVRTCSSSLGGTAFSARRTSTNRPFALAHPDVSRHP